MAFRGADGTVALWRFFGDLERDTSFAAAGVARSFAGTPQSLQSLADGKTLVAGFTSGAASAIALAVQQLNSDGSPDTTFGAASGTVTMQIGGVPTIARAAVVDPDGRIVVVGFTAGASTASFILRLWR